MLERMSREIHLRSPYERRSSVPAAMATAARNSISQVPEAAVSGGTSAHLHRHVQVKPHCIAGIFY